MWKWLSLIHTYPNHDTFWWKLNWSMFLQILQPAMAILVGHQQKASSRLGGDTKPHLPISVPPSPSCPRCPNHLSASLRWEGYYRCTVLILTQDASINHVQWPKKNQGLSLLVQLPQIHNPDLPKVVYTPFKWGCLEYLVAMPRCHAPRVTDHSCGCPAGSGVTWWKTGCRWCLGQCSPWTSSLRRSKSEMGIVVGQDPGNNAVHIFKNGEMDGILGYSWIFHEVRIYCTYFGDVGALW